MTGPTAVTVPGVSLVIRGRRVVLPDGERAAAVAIGNGRIAAVLPAGAPVPGAAEIVLSDDEVLLPGLVDTHVHVNEPGRTGWEGFTTATRAASAGGVTTIVDMPLNSDPPTIDPAALDVKRAAARAAGCYVDVGFWGGAVPTNVGRLSELLDAGALGVKCFLVDSGIPEFPPLDDLEVASVLREIAAVDGVLLAHAEDPAVLAAAPQPRGRSYQDFLASRPAEAEDQAIARLVTLAAVTGARVHIVHLSSASALPLLADARRDGVRITAETCPHYLSLAADDIPDGATQYKCCPPIRDAANRDGLWKGLADGLIDLVVSDHCPCPAALKSLASGDFEAAWGGISSLQLGLPVVWTVAKDRGHGLADVAHWMAAAPAGLAGLPSKGRITVGADADLCVFAPAETWLIEPAALHHRHPLTPYTGRLVTGRVRATWLRGKRISDSRPTGRLLSGTSDE
jgi:allantoinase